MTPDTVHTEEATMQLRVLLEPSPDGGYTVIVPSLPGCISEGNTLKKPWKTFVRRSNSTLSRLRTISRPRPGWLKRSNSPFEYYSRTGLRADYRGLRRDGWVVVRQKGSHIRLQKNLKSEVLKLTIPSHRPVKRSTLAHILKQAKIDLDRFLSLI